MQDETDCCNCDNLSRMPVRGQVVYWLTFLWLFSPIQPSHPSTYFHNLLIHCPFISFRQMLYHLCRTRSRSEINKGDTKQLQAVRFMLCFFTTHCSHRLIVRSELGASTCVTTREHPTAEGGTVGEKCPGILPKCRLPRYN
jgi:hypothetical protein